MNDQADYIALCADLYRKTLLEDVMPFWMRHGFDEQYGGISNILDDAGNALNHDKYLWSQGRALWTFSALYHRVEQREEWRRFAHHLYQYLAAHGRDEAGRWMYRLDQNGEVLERDLSIYVDGFVMNGMAEYAAATGNRFAMQIALDTYENINARVQVPGSYGAAPYEIPPGMKTHGMSMIFAFFFFHLGTIAERNDICERAMEYALEVLNDFYIPEKDAIVEFVSLDGQFSDSPPGRACVPGHALEALWFLISIFETTNDHERIATCCRLIRRHLELGWDEEYGGLRLALDIDGQEPLYWKSADCKPWWVQVEALVATAYAHFHTGEDWCLDWHRKVQEWAYAHYPVATGEWTPWVDRAGNKTPNTILPVKDPFHLPRAMIYLMDLFEKRIPSATRQT